AELPAEEPELLRDPGVVGVLKGSPGAAERLGLDRAELLDLLRRMVLLRVYDERSVAWQRQGRLGTYPTYWGEEGVQVGAVSATRPDDWLFPSYRQACLGILRGEDPADYLRLWRGDGRGLHGPRAFGCAPLTVPIATHLPHAVGAAWAMRLRGESSVTVAFFGDGATSEGDFHEGVNHAAVLEAPVVFVCTNNQWAISTPVSRQTRVTHIADKAAAYGVPAVRVDGFDVPAVHLACRDAVERARGGGGPTLVEAVCYRIGPHGTADDPSLYRADAEGEEWRRIEPIARLRRWLEHNALYDEGTEEGFRAAARTLVGEAMARVEADVAPPSRAVVDGVYAHTPDAILRHFAAIESDRAAHGGEAAGWRG
ncbi:MAG TPA: thiamine pyrophosphate-dependent enzyme, partial [Candidatus Dormibacteraeota bacterium]|nr:thiamine pyrophosphate-dependent enzyme [Candidatus Dormibacteraeota bacterium]